jgi:hypothetical protein
MATCYLAPDPIQSMQFIPGGIVPANGGQLFFYTAGTSTKTTVYKDNAGAVAWSNPIVLDSGGNLPSGGEVWFLGGTTYKVVFAPSNDTDPPASPYWTKDNLQGTNDVSSQISALEWVTASSPTFVSTTQFTVAGDQRTTFVAGRRVKTTNTGGTIYGTITSNSFAAATTTVNVVTDTGVLDAGLSAVAYGLINPANTSIDASTVNKKATAVASAGNGTTNIWGTAGDYVHVTGTNAIFNFSTAPYAGMRRDVVFDSALTINTSATLTTPGNVIISAAAGDVAQVRAETVSTATIISYQGATPLFGPQASSQVLAGPTTGTTSVAPSFRGLVGAESAMQLISVTSFTIPVNTVNITWSSSAPYDEYELHIWNYLPTSANSTLQLRVTQDGGATFVSSGSYKWSGLNVYTGGTVTANTSGAAQTSLQISYVNDIGNGAGCHYEEVLKIYRPSNSTATKSFSWTALNQGNPGIEQGFVSGGGYVSTVAAINGVQLLANSGNISSGSFALYGIRRS